MHEYRRKRLIKKPRISSYCIIAIIIFQKISNLSNRNVDRSIVEERQVGLKVDEYARNNSWKNLFQRKILSRIIKKYFGSFARTNERCNTGQTKRFKVRLLTIPNTAGCDRYFNENPAVLPFYFHLSFIPSFFNSIALT